MKKEQYQFDFLRVTDRALLSHEDSLLLQQAMQAAEKAYAPYSNFLVGAAAKLSTSVIVVGSNQENASYPVGVCAERVLLGLIGSQYPEVPIETMAITYQTSKRDSNVPVSPCGMCRQALVEYENRVKRPIRLLLAGMTGDVLLIESSRLLLPFAFESSYLK
jgi:cytidine deaminase